MNKIRTKTDLYLVCGHIAIPQKKTNNITLSRISESYLLQLVLFS